MILQREANWEEEEEEERAQSTKGGQLERERGRGDCLKMEWKREVGKTKEEIWRDVPERVEAIRKASIDVAKSNKK